MKIEKQGKSCGEFFDSKTKQESEKKNRLNRIKTTIKYE